MRIFIRLSETLLPVSQNTERWNSFNKKTILKKCWISLMMNLTPDDSVEVYCHNVSDKTLKWLDDNSECLIKFVKTNSLEENFVLPLQNMKKEIDSDPDEKAVYAYLEDDYLWDKNSLFIIKDTFRHWSGFLIPNDFPSNYKQKSPMCGVFIGTDRYWRTSNYISFNMFGTVSIWKKHIEDFIICAKTQNIEALNLLRQSTYILNPMPSLATHLKEHEMSPLVDWGFIWEGIKI